MKANHSLEIADWQRKYDEQRWEERSHRQMMKTVIAFLSFLFVLTMGIWWYWRRVRSLRFRLDEHARRITENQAEIERLQQSGEASEQTIADLKKQIEDSRQRIASKLLTGTRQFVKLQHKEPVADMTAEFRPAAPQALAGVGTNLHLTYTLTICLSYSSGRSELRRQYYRPNPQHQAHLPPHPPIKDQRKGEVSNQSNAEIICIVFPSISTSRVCVKAMRDRRLQESASDALTSDEVSRSYARGLSIS